MEDSNRVEVKLKLVDMERQNITTAHRLQLTCQCDWSISNVYCLDWTSPGLNAIKSMAKARHIAHSIHQLQTTIHSSTPQGRLSKTTSIQISIRLMGQRSNHLNLDERQSRLDFCEDNIGKQHISQIRAHTMHNRNRTWRQAAHLCNHHVDILRRRDIVHDVQQLQIGSVFPACQR